MCSRPKLLKYLILKRPRPKRWGTNLASYEAYLYTVVEKAYACQYCLSGL